jgi:UDP-N-acetylmuramate--alanine ligase
MDIETIRKGLTAYVGVHRRLELKGEAGGIAVVDDYGHHPTEIRETLAAARQVWKGRMMVVFQPHRYTRTKALYDEFLTAFSNADTLILTDIYPASEDPIPGVTAENLCQGIREKGHPDVTYLANGDDIVTYLLSRAKASDVIITQGAGNVYKVGESFLSRAAQV